MSESIAFCKGGGCTMKLGPKALSKVLSALPEGIRDERLLVGFDSNDDASVYRVTDDLAIVQTLDFFPPMIEDPYLFGQIAAANALSDVYAMGGTVKTALNIVCFPETMDLNILGEILKGGQEKVTEAGGILAGGHSIMDEGVKYGLSVMGTIHPKRILTNNHPKEGDALILTKPLGVGIICTAARVGEASKEALEKAIQSMTMLNKRASELLLRSDVHACTDVTGFGFLGHLHEMLNGAFSAEITTLALPIFEEALQYADEFLLTAAAQRNRNALEKEVFFDGVSFACEEVLFDPQTSGGLLAAVAEDDAEQVTLRLREEGMDAAIVGRVIKKAKKEIHVTT